MMLLTAFLLMSTNIVCLHGNSVTDHGLRCENDYLYTINCSLSITSADPCCDNCSYWLVFTQRLLEAEDEKYECMLSNAGGYYYCSLDKSLQTPVDDYYQNPETFTDTDHFEVSLCHNRGDASESCELIDKDYMPSKNITPDTPCCLTVIHNSSKYHFSWKSCYENLRYFYLTNYLVYQLHYYKRGHRENPISLQADKRNISVDDLNFVPDTEYTIRVRSSPNQDSYKGEWSEWSSAVHWKTAPVRDNSSTNTVVHPLDKRVVIPLCLLAPLLLLLCYAPVVKLRRSTYIPTPAPYFQSLYSDCQGDFKTWVVTPVGNEADLLKTEETLQIDILTKSTAAIQEDDGASQLHQLVIQEGPPCGSISSHPASDASLLGIPYCVTPGPPPLVSAPRDPLKSLSLTSVPGSMVEGDSGCWLCSVTSLDGDSPWYRNEYCTLSDTLSAFQTQQSTGAVTAEHCCSESSLSEVVSNGDYQNEC